MTPLVSVITCTYNPRPDYLARTVAALRAQTLSMADWEYLVIDNNSSQSLSIDLSWHPAARLLSEPKPGKVHALLRAIAEAQGELLVIVDDDNVLASDYLEKVLHIARTKPFLGVWGGQIVPEFEVPPPDWAQPYLSHLTLKSSPREEWSNLHSGAAPAGAGMCLRKTVAHQFTVNLTEHPERLQLGRTGSSVITGEDWEMALSACDLGLGMSHQPQLSLTHLINRHRLEMNYLLHLVETMTFSCQVFAHIRGLHHLRTHPPTRWQRLTRQVTLWRMDPVRRKFVEAQWRAQAAAEQALARNDFKDYADREKSAAEQTGVRTRG